MTGLHWDQIAGWLLKTRKTLIYFNKINKLIGKNNRFIALNFQETLAAYHAALYILGPQNFYTRIRAIHIQVALIGSELQCI